tara:strand:- start:169 stop:915 length:747 start_codon:yes stop_codon:yes gene_type:complete
MNDLPQSVSTFGWSWERFVAPYGSSENFWLGTDREGNRWLTKLRGPFYAYREIVFARLAQAMNWSCQSSVFLNLDPVSASVLGVKPDITHAAHWFMPEHKRQLCSGGCAVKFLFDKEIRTVDDLVGSQIEHLLDWPKSEFAAFLFGANEPPGRLFTTAHEFVIIDSEQMFSSGPCDFDTASWWNAPNGEPSLSGRMLAEQVCADLLSLSERDIKDALSIPKGIEVRENWPIAPIIRASRKFAVSFDGL